MLVIISKNGQNEEENKLKKNISYCNKIIFIIQWTNTYSQFLFL